jgi:hypothetical protein
MASASHKQGAAAMQRAEVALQRTEQRRFAAPTYLKDLQRCHAGRPSASQEEEPVGGTRDVHLRRGREVRNQAGRVGGRQGTAILRERPLGVEQKQQDQCAYRA